MKSGERRTQIAVVILVFAFAAVASACPVCYGTQQTPLTKSVSNGVLFLLGIVGSVQIGFVALFVSFWKRTKALQQKREQFQIIEGGKER
jgi:Na+/proline symporter